MNKVIPFQELFQEPRNAMPFGGQEDVVVLFRCFGQQEAFPVGARHQHLVTGAQIAQVVGAHPEEQLVAVGIFGIGIFEITRLVVDRILPAVFASGGEAIEYSRRHEVCLFFAGGHHPKRLSGPERTLERGP